MLLLFAAALALDVVAVVLHVGQAPRLAAAAAEAGGVAVLEHLDALRQHARAGAVLLAGILLQFLLLVPSVVHVLRELGAFVLAQRTDLLARDQAAEFQNRQRAAAAGR